MKQLSDILINVSQNELTRAQAAIQLKNTIYSKDETVKAQYQERWLQLPEEIRAYIKNNCIQALGTETKRPSQAAQCVGYIACAELPRGLWPDCISITSLKLKKIEKKFNSIILSNSRSSYDECHRGERDRDAQGVEFGGDRLHLPRYCIRSPNRILISRIVI